jgi:hypothetical protein
MVGAFGLLDGWHDELIPASALVETHPAADVHQLARCGLLTPGTNATIGGRDGHGGYRVAVPEPGSLELDGQRFRLDWHPFSYRVIVCGGCDRICRKVHRVGTVWSCRKCAGGGRGLEYSSRHLRRTVGRGALVRLQFLRGRVGASLEPFSELPTKPKPGTSAVQHLRLLHEVRKLEEDLVRHAHADVARVLEKRYARS